MNQDKDSLAELVAILLRVNPQLLDIISAETEEEFEKAFMPFLEQAIIHLETNKKNFKPLDENGLTAVFAACFKGIGLTVSQETNSNGHVDLTLVADYCTPVRRKLVEAKIYRSFSYHISGLSQLLLRYTTGREGSGILIEYVKEKDIKDLLKKLRERMDSELPFEQVDKSIDLAIKWAFITEHKHSSGENFKVQHIGCNLF